MFDIFKNEILYSGIVSTILLIFGWLKGYYDVRTNNKKMGYWKIKFKKRYSFYDVAMKTYKYLAINTFFQIFVRAICSIWIPKMYTGIVVGMSCFCVNAIITLYISKYSLGKIELWDGRGMKRILLWSLCFIFSVFFFEELFFGYTYMWLIVFSIVLIVWCIILCICTDVVLVLDKSFADIHVNGAGIVKRVRAGEIEKKGSWIYVNSDFDGYEQEIRIKESEIVRVDYYGESKVIIKKYGSKKMYEISEDKLIIQ